MNGQSSWDDGRRGAQALSARASAGVMAALLLFGACPPVHVAAMPVLNPAPILTIDDADATFPYGVDVVLTVTLSDPAATADVVFRAETPAGQLILGSASPGGTGSATLATSAIPVHATALVGSYTGGGGYVAADSPAVTVTVTRPTLTVHPDSVSITAGDPLPGALGWTLSGFARGEQAGTAGVSGTPVLSTTAVASTVGSYPIACDSIGALGAPNYAFACGGPATLLVNAAPNAAPVADDGSLTLDEDAPATGGIVTAGDPDADPLAYVLEADVAHGTLVLAADGAYTYEPEPDFHGPDGFSFGVSDQNGGTDTGTVTITVTPVNDPPVADDAILTTIEGTPVVDAAAAVDVDGDVLHYAVTVDPAHGGVAIDASTGAFTYSPVPGYVGPDTFTFSADDGHGGTDAATVAITVAARNHAPAQVFGAANFTGVYAYNDADGAWFVQATPIDTGMIQAAPRAGLLHLGSSAGGSSSSGVIIAFDGSVRLGGFHGGSVVSGGSALTINVYLDSGNDGRFFAFSDTQLTGLAGDSYGSVTLGATGGTFDDGTVFAKSGGIAALPATFTLAQLRSGAVGGIDAGTRVAFWIGGGSSFSADISSISLAASTAGTLTVLEDSGLTSMGLEGITFGPGGDAGEAGQSLDYTVTVVPGAALGTVVLADGVTVVTAGTSYTLTELQGMRLRTTADANGSGERFDVTVHDNGGTLDGGVDAITMSLALAVTPVNDAPTLGNGTLAPVPEDTAWPAGQAVSTIFAGQFADVDAGSSLDGIVVVGNAADASTQGTWQYSTGGGTTWAAIGDVAHGPGGLAIGSSTLVRFVPVADATGSPAPLVVRALDDTYTGGHSTTAGGETRVTVDTTAVGGTTAIAGATATLSTSVTAVGDAPIVTTTATPLAYAEGAPAAAIDPGLTVSDVDSANLTGATARITGGDSSGQDVLLFAGTAEITASWDAVTGTLTLSGSDTVANYQAALRSLTFRNTSETPSLSTRTVSVTISDDTASSNTATRAITVTPVNDAPVRTAGSPPAFGGNEDGANVTAITLGLGALAYGRGGGSDEAGQTLAYTVTAIPAQVTLWLANGTTRVTAGAPVTLVQLQGLKVKTVANASGGGALTWTVVDSGGTANGGVDTLTETLAIAISPVADTPSISAATTVEDTQTSSGLVITRNAADGAEVTHLRITAITNGTLFKADGTTPLAEGSFITFAEGGAGLRFMPPANFSGTGSFAIQASTSAGAAGLGGSTVTRTVTVTPGNDSPTITDGVTIGLPDTDEDTPSAATTVDAILTGAGWADIDSGALKGIAVTSTIGNGAWQYSTDGASWAAFGAVMSGGALLLTSTTRVRYLPDGNAAEDAEFTFVAWDRSSGAASVNGTPRYASAGARGGTTAYSSQSGTVGQVVGALGDAPIANPDDGHLDFDGVDDLVVVADSPSLTMTTTLTMEAWIKPGAPGASSPLILNKEGEYEIGLAPDNTFRWAFASTSPGWTWINTGYVVPGGAWTHVAVTYDHGAVSAFVNGNLVGSYAGSGSLNDAHPTFDELRIGGRTNNPPGQYFAGSIDDVRVWNVARTPAEVMASMDRRLAGDEIGLVGYWRFSELPGSVATDSSPSANHGLLGGGVPDQVPSRVGLVTDEDVPLVVDAARGALANDRHGDGDPLSLTALEGSQAAVGRPTAIGSGALVTVEADGSYSYVANGAFASLAPGQAATDTFAYTVSDGSGNTATSLVQVTVYGLADAPVAADDPDYAGVEDVTLHVDPAEGLLANDTDADGDPLSVVEVTDPAHGDLTWHPDGSFDYLPNADWSGVDTFAYTVSDGHAGTATATVTIAVLPVNDAPVALDDAVTVVSGSIATDIDVVANDGDVDGDLLELSGVASTGAAGTATVAGNRVRFKPALGYAGTVTVAITISDGHLTDTADLVITVVPDTTPPAIPTAVAHLGNAVVGDTGTRVTVGWSSTDAGSGLARYTVQVSRDGGDYLTQYSGAAASTPLAVSFGRRYDVRVRATDAAGNTSAWGHLVVRPVVIESLHGGVTYTKPSPWTPVDVPRCSGTGYRYSAVRGATATFTFTGREIAWIAPRLPSSGTADVYVDGSKAGAVDLRSGTAVWARPAFRRAWDAAGRHTIKLVVTSTGRRVGLDAFVILR